MKTARENQRVLWGAFACVALALSAAAASAHPAPAPDTDRAALIWLRISSPIIESQAQLLRSDIRFPIDSAADRSDPRAIPVITIEALLAIRNRALEHRLALSRTGALASIGAARVASADGSGAWTALALQALHGESEADSEDIAAAEFEGRSWFAPSIAAAPRRLKDLFVGATNRRWDDPGDDFLPDSYPDRYSVYPSPGAAGLALIAGGCVMGRRRR